MFDKLLLKKVKLEDRRTRLMLTFWKRTVYIYASVTLTSIVVRIIKMCNFSSKMQFYLKSPDPMIGKITLSIIYTYHSFINFVLYAMLILYVLIHILNFLWKIWTTATRQHFKKCTIWMRQNKVRLSHQLT